MLDLVAPILYFLALFGLYEGVLFKRRIDYWHAPVLVSTYFLLGTLGGLILFSMEPVLRLLYMSVYEIAALAGVLLLLIVGALTGRFAYTPGGEGSLGYAAAKAADVLFQITMAVIVVLAFEQLLGMVYGGAAFALYFFVAHLLLFFILPARYAIIFATASLVGGSVLAYIALTHGGVGYLVALHLSFYIASYPLMRRVRLRYLK